MTPFSPSAAVRAAFAAGFALTLLAGCVTPEPAYPVRLDEAAPAPSPPPPPPPPPPAPPKNDGSVTAAPSKPVDTKRLPPVGAPRALPPIGANSARPGASRAPPLIGANAARGLPPIGAVPAAKPLSGAPTVYEAAPAAAASTRVTTVARGETVFEIAEREKVPVRALIDANGLQPPYDLPTGTLLQVPAPTAYTIIAGDTLFGVARRFSVDPRGLASLNSLPPESSMRPGQRLSLPPESRDQGPIAGAMGQAPPLALATRPPIARPTTGALAAPVEEPALSAAAPPPEPPSAEDIQVAAAGKGRFVWPVHGEVLSTFGPKGPGQRNDGLNIATTPGEAIKAAAAGEVAYAGELPGFGNLVLLKHAGGWVTAYAHLSKLEVKMRDRVAQGQEVGQAGQTGQVDRPQLHFEVRYASNPKEKARPVDPSLLLPGLG